MDNSARLRVGIYIAFVACGLVYFTGAPGDDLSSSYIACRLLASGASAHLYDHHATLFHVVATPVWKSTALDAGFLGFLHPYVQTPLWAWGLQPLCTQLDFDAFSALFLGLALLSLVITIEIVARTWAPVFLSPISLIILLSAIALTTPFQYAMWLVQTHALFLAMSVAAIVAAGRGKSALAGALLAMAAAVKITPALLLLYWLIIGQRRAAAWFMACSICLLLITGLATGPSVLESYFLSMQRVSDVLLVAYNNQSLVAWLTDLQGSSIDLKSWRIHALTPTLKIVSLLSSLSIVLVAAWKARQTQESGRFISIALIGLTIFSPIAWTHYYLVLIPAVMVLMQIGGRKWLPVAVIVLLLNMPPLALNPITPNLDDIAIVRSHFYSGLLLILALASCHLKLKRK